MATGTLKILRELHDYTQAFVAEDVLGISQATYARLEASPLKLTAEQAQKLAALYNVSAEHLPAAGTPVIVFKQAEDSNSTAQLAATLTALQTQNELLIQQNTELVKLIKTLSQQTALLYE